MTPTPPVYSHIRYKPHARPRPQIHSNRDNHWRTTVSVFATRLSKHLLIAATLLLLAQLAVVPAQAQTQITTCGTNIKLAGTYILANDLLNCPGDGIDITFGHVTLELGNHQITGSGTGTGIRVARTGLVVREVKIHGPATIANFDKGIVVSSSLNGEVNQVTCTGNNTGFTFELQYDSADNQIHDNIATMNHGAGFVINGEWSHYERNRSSENVGSGFVLTPNHAENNFVNGNTADQNGSDGIEAQSGAVHNLIYENHATGNSTLDLADNNPAGCPNTWYRNGFGTSNKKCIE